MIRLGKWSPSLSLASFGCYLCHFEREVLSHLNEAMGCSQIKAHIPSQLLVKPKTVGDTFIWRRTVE